MKRSLITSSCIIALFYSAFAFNPGVGMQPNMGEQPGMQQPPGEGRQQPDMPSGTGSAFVYDTFITESTGVGIDVRNGVWISTDRTRASIISDSNLVDVVVGAAAGSTALISADLRMSSALAEVPSCAFAGCENLETVILPTSVSNNVALDAFIGCPKLKSISYIDAMTDPVTPDQKTTPDEPSEPDQPLVPDLPVEPDQPVVPDQPTPPDQEDNPVSQEKEHEDMSGMETTYAQTFYGYITDANGISGTLTVSTSKANSRTGIVTVKVVIWPFGGKKSTVTAKTMPDSDSPTTISFADAAETTLTLTANGLSGTCAYGTIVASRDFSKRKTDARYAEYDRWVGTRTCAFATFSATGDAADFAGGYSTFAIRVVKKGIVNIAGTMGDGTTFSQSTRLQLSMDGAKARIPVLGRLYKGRAGGFGFVLELGTNGNARADAVAPWDASCRTGGGFNASLISVTNGIPSKLSCKNAVLTSDDLDGTTITAVSFSSSETTGALRGSYRAVFPDLDSKRYSVTLRGVTIDGIGYATSVIKKLGTYPTEVMPCSEF